jgi:hypothetical protein
MYSEIGTGHWFIQWRRNLRRNWTADVILKTRTYAVYIKNVTLIINESKRIWKALFIIDM